MSGTSPSTGAGLAPYPHRRSGRWPGGAPSTRARSSGGGRCRTGSPSMRCPDCSRCAPCSGCRRRRRNAEDGRRGPMQRQTVTIASRRPILCRPPGRKRTHGAVRWSPRIGCGASTRDCVRTRRGGRTRSEQMPGTMGRGQRDRRIQLFTDNDVLRSAPRRASSRRASGVGCRGSTTSYRKRFGFLSEKPGQRHSASRPFRPLRSRRKAWTRTSWRPSSSDQVPTSRPSSTFSRWRPSGSTGSATTSPLPSMTNH